MEGISDQERHDRLLKYKKNMEEMRKFAIEEVKQNGLILSQLEEKYQKDKVVVLEAVKRTGGALQFAGQELKSDKEVVLEAVKNDGGALRHACEELRNDKEVVLEAVKRSGYPLQYASQEVRNDKEVVLVAVKQYGGALEYCGYELQNDKEVVFQALKHDGYCLEHASRELRKDKEVVLEAVKNDSSHDGNSLEYASKQLQKDREVVLEAVRKNGRSLRYAAEELKNDKEVVLEALKQNAQALQYANKELLNDREFVLDAVKKYGCSLDAVGEEMRGDKEVVLEAVRLNGFSLNFASEELRNDKEIVLVAVKGNGYSLQFASEELKNDKEVVIEAGKRVSSGDYLSYAGEEIKSDKQFILEAVKKRGESLKYASEDLRNDKEVVLEAVKQNGFSLASASGELRNDREVVLQAVKQNGVLLRFATQELQNDKEVVLEAVRSVTRHNLGYISLQFASQELRNDKEVVMEAIKQNVYSIQYASGELLNDKEVILEAMRIDPRSLQCASPSLQKYFAENPPNFESERLDSTLEDIHQTLEVGEGNPDLQKPISSIVDESEKILESIIQSEAEVEEEGEVSPKEESFVLAFATLCSERLKDREYSIDVLKSYLSKPKNEGSVAVRVKLGENELKRGRLSDAKKTLNKVLEEETTSDSVRCVANEYLSDIEIQNNQPDKALEYIKKSLELCDEKKETEKKSDLLYKAASIHVKARDPQTALKLVEESLSVCEKTKKVDTKENVKKVYLRSALRKQTGDVKGCVADMNDLIRSKFVRLQDKVVLFKARGAEFERKGDLIRASDSYLKAKKLVEGCKEIKVVGGLRLSEEELSCWKENELVDIGIKIARVERKQRGGASEESEGSQTETEIRMAFVVGIENYCKRDMDVSMGNYALPGSAENYSNVKKLLEDAGFEDVFELYNSDVTLEKFIQKLRTFTDTRNNRKKDFPNRPIVTFFYFTGHGGYADSTIFHLKKKGIMDLKKIKLLLRSENTTNLYFLDCCQSYASNMVSSVYCEDGEREEDFKPLQEEKEIIKPSDEYGDLSCGNHLVSVCQEPGLKGWHLKNEKGGVSGPYTDALVKHLGTRKNWNIESLMKMVRKDVVESTKKLDGTFLKDEKGENAKRTVGRGRRAKKEDVPMYRMKPWYSSDLDRDFIWNRTIDHKDEIGFLRVRVIDLEEENVGLIAKVSVLNEEIERLRKENQLLKEGNFET